MTSLPMHRARARVLCLDPAGRVLLFVMDRASSDAGEGRVWCAPGDIVSDTEKPAHVAARVAHRVFGRDVEPDELGGVVAATSGIVPTPDGSQLRATDSYFALTLDPDDRGGDRDPGPDDDHSTRRWWTPEEIEAADEAIVPAGLADLIRRLASDQEMTHPIRLPLRDAAG